MPDSPIVGGGATTRSVEDKRAKTWNLKSMSSGWAEGKGREIRKDDKKERGRGDKVMKGLGRLLITLSLEVQCRASSLLPQLGSKASKTQHGNSRGTQEQQRDWRCINVA